MRINIILFLFAMFLGGGLTLWLDTGTAPPQTKSSPQIVPGKMDGEIFPDFTFVDLNGKSHDSHASRGKIIILNFWATWCAPCVIEFPKLMKLASDHPDIVVMALSSDISDEKIKLFLKKNPITVDNFIVARDNKRKITEDLFKTYKLPETLIISPSGVMVKKIIGDTDWNGHDIMILLDHLRKEKS